MYSYVNEDLSGVALLEGHRTATYCAVLQNHGGLMFGIGDMDIHGHISPQYIDHFTGDISKSKLVCIDGNITPEAIAHACKICHTHGVPVWYEPTDIHKATKPFQKHVEDLIWLTSPNLNELRAMYNCLLVSADKEQTVSFNADEMSIDSIIEDCVHMAKVVVTKIPVVMVTVGKHGVILCQRIVEDDQTVDGAIITRDGRYMTVDWFPATVKGREPRNIVSVSGAGDCLAATMIASIVQGHDLHNSLKSGLLAAQLSLQSHHAVPPTISVNSVQWEDEFDGSFQAKRIINIE